MGKLKNGLHGGISGKIGNLIYSSWKGKPYVKTRPDKVKNPRTKGQTASRSAFAVVQSLIGGVSSFVRDGFAAKAIGMSAYNAAISYNLLHAVDKSSGRAELVFPALLFSTGLYSGLTNIQMQSFESGKLKITWESGEGSAKDIVGLVAVNEPLNRSQSFSSFARREEQLSIITFPDDWKGQNIHIYVSVKPAEAITGSKGKAGISESVYAGVAVV